jgi:hypothetical protein
MQYNTEGDFMKWTVKTNKFDKNDTVLVSLIQLLCSLEFAVSSAKWYVGEEAKRSALPPHEHVLALAINIASIGEALHRFENFKNRGIIQHSDSWDQVIKDSWTYLESDEVSELKRQNLKYVRDKSAFHIDPEPVEQFIESLTRDDELDIWEIEEGNSVGHSPLAAQIIANTLLKIQMDNQTTAANTSKVYKALRDVVGACLFDKLS